jgi:hypothetical protein
MLAITERQIDKNCCYRNLYNVSSTLKWLVVNPDSGTSTVWHSPGAEGRIGGLNERGRNMHENVQLR